MVGSLEKLRAQYYSSFKRAETAIKRAEHAGEDLPIPCVNELRYAGFHHIAADKARSEGRRDVEEEEMRKAIRHANRANFDAAEFYVAVYSERARAVLESYRGYEYLAARHIPEYEKHIRAINEIGNLIDGTHVLDKEAPDYISRCEDICEKLKAFLDAFSSVEKSLFSEIYAKESGRKIAWGQCFFGIFGGAVLGFILGKFFG